MSVGSWIKFKLLFHGPLAESVNHSVFLGGNEHHVSSGELFFPEFCRLSLCCSVCTLSSGLEGSSFATCHPAYLAVETAKRFGI